MNIAICRSIAVALVLASLSGLAFGQARGVIQGFVFGGRDRLPLSDIYVELTDDMGATIQRRKTDGGGRYGFSGLSAGRFRVRVLPYNTNFAEQTRDVEMYLSSPFSKRMDLETADFYLQLDPRKVPMDESGTVGVVFLQDIPSEAKMLYRRAVANFENSKEMDLGFQAMKKALEIFPDYYEALNRISIEYVRRSQYHEAIPHLVRAVTVNQRSFTSFYMLGSVAYNLKQYKEAGEAFRAATILNPSSAQSFVKYGMLLRISGDYVNAERALMKATSLTKNNPLPEAFWQLGLLFERQSKFEEAANYLEKFLKADPDNEKKADIRALIVKFRAKKGEKA